MALCGPVYESREKVTTKKNDGTRSRHLGTLGIEYKSIE